MAIEKLSPKATYVELGYGQVEPNHLSAQVNGQIYAQLPLAKTVEVLENGMFAKYDYQNGVVNVGADIEGEWMLVYNTVKLYDEDEVECDYAMKNITANAKAAVVPASTDVVPRLFATKVGDIFTTNTIVADTLAVGDELAPNAEGYLSAEGDTTAMKWVVVKVYTMPDGQKGVKIMRVA